MTDQKGTTRQRDSYTSGISEEMNCDNRSETGGCGKYGHSLDHHSMVNGSLVCSYCGSSCPVKPYPVQLHLLVEGHHAKTQVPVKNPKTGKVTFVEVPKKTPEGAELYLCPNCRAEFVAGHIGACPKQVPHIGCHIYSRWKP